MTDKLWVLVEHQDGELNPVVFELLTEAAKLKTDIGGEVEAVILAGNKGVSQLSELSEYGAQTILVGRNNSLSEYDADIHVPVLAELALRYKPRLILVGETPVGSQISRRLASRLGVSFVSDYTRIQVQRNSLVATRLVYNGKVGATLKVLHEPLVATLKPGMIRINKPMNSCFKKVEEVIINSIPRHKRVEVIKNLPLDPEGMELSEADIVVGAGKGVCFAESFPLLQEMAIELKAKVGGSRRAVDKGWVPSKDLIGQTGQTISPQLYIAVGISGASHHLAGIRDAKLKIAINIDRHAPIFNQSDLSVVGDAQQVLPAITRHIRALKQKGLSTVNKIDPA